MNNIFDRSKHVYKSKAFEEIIKDTIRFFNGTPVHNCHHLRILQARVYMLYIMLGKALIINISIM